MVAQIIATAHSDLYYCKPETAPGTNMWVC